MGSKSAPGPSAAQKRAEQRKEAEIVELDRQEKKRVAAAGRRRRGRSSLISGATTGLREEG